MDYFADAMAYGEEREFRVHDEFNRFVREQRAIWTPRDIFNKCCVKWLVYGKDNSYYDRDIIEDQLNDGNVVGRGCDYCERQHPKIELSYDPELNVTVATLSHLLDPFVSYMEALVADKGATKVGDNMFQLDGYLRENVRKIRMNATFGKHLVTFNKKDLELSDKAQRDTSGYIELSFDPGLNVTVATLSHHLLDPFVSYMEERVEDKSATKVSENTFHLDGFLRENLKKMRMDATFGMHLVSVKKKELDLSDMAQRAASGTKQVASSTKRALKASRKAQRVVPPTKKARKNQEDDTKKKGDTES